MHAHRALMSSSMDACHVILVGHYRTLNVNVLFNKLMMAIAKIVKVIYFYKNRLSLFLLNMYWIRK